MPIFAASAQKINVYQELTKGPMDLKILSKVLIGLASAGGCRNKISPYVSNTE
jgi:hypothetical protein